MVWNEKSRKRESLFVSCECGKDQSFSDCCGPIIAGTVPAGTAEQLMRSRFVAFGLGDFDYIDKTQIETLPSEIRQRQAPEWESLEILSCSEGGPDDDEGTVEFIAYYRLNGRRLHRELSRFIRVGPDWRYKDGDIVDELVDDIVSQKVGRNEPCPCGSGRKFKRCCGL